MISVGNISVGGTGKSVVVAYIAQRLHEQSGAIILRGYRGANEKSKRSFVVFDGKIFFCSALFSGDEAHMLARQTKLPVVVGASRMQSITLVLRILSWRAQKLDYVVLDDGYQNASIKKTLNIVLLNAQAPFGNGHCLPAGPLRERDILRADAIILTHADTVSSAQLEATKSTVRSLGFKEMIGAARHEVLALVGAQSTRMSRDSIKGKRVGVFAGIGSFATFYESVQSLGAHVAFSEEYADHFSYKKEDLDYVINRAEFERCDFLVTTFKDWSKLCELHDENLLKGNVPIFYLEIQFSFLGDDDQNTFDFLLKKSFS